MYSLGLAFSFQDSAACLFHDGVVVAAAEEERFTRNKHDGNFPIHSINFCLEQAGIRSIDLDAVIFYEKPFLKFDRIVQSHIWNWPKSFSSFLKIPEEILGSQIRVKSIIKKNITVSCPILFCNHHLSQAAAAFFTSPFQSAAIITLNGAGEWATTAIHHGSTNSIRTLREIHHPHSLDLFYKAIFVYLGFDLLENEYEILELFSNEEPTLLSEMSELLRLSKDGSFELNCDFFSFKESGCILNEHKMRDLVGFGKRSPSDPIEPHHRNLASSAQEILEKAVITLALHAFELTKESNLCIGGGLPSYCMRNLNLNHPSIQGLNIFPAQGDSAGAIGAAIFGYYQLSNKDRSFNECNSPYLGPEFTQMEIDAYLDRAQIPHTRFHTSAQLVDAVAHLLKNQKIIGWFQGRMEFGPQALGNRSILSSPGEKITRSQTLGTKVNPLFDSLLENFKRQTGIPGLVNRPLKLDGIPVACTPQNAFQCFAQSDLDGIVLGSSLILRESFAYLHGKQG